MFDNVFLLWYDVDSRKTKKHIFKEVFYGKQKHHFFIGWGIVASV